MSRTRSPFDLLLAGLLGLTLALGASACSSDQTAEEAVEQAAEDAGEDVEVDVDGDEITIESSDGTVSMGGDLPDGFPEDDVPLVEGDVLVAMGAEGQGFQVSLNVDMSAAEAMDEAVALLEGAGFTVEETAEMGTMQTAALTSDAHQVFLTATDESGDTTLIYAVEVAGQ